MSIHFTLQENGLLLTKPDDCAENLDSFEELLRITQRLSGGEIVREAVQTNCLKITLAARRDFDLLNANNRDAVQRAIEEAIKQNLEASISMRKHGEEFIVCRLAFSKDKAYWKVTLAKDFTSRELSYLANVLRDTSILYLNKNIRH